MLNIQKTFKMAFIIYYFATAVFAVFMFLKKGSIEYEIGLWGTYTSGAMFYAYLLITKFTTITKNPKLLALAVLDLVLTVGLPMVYTKYRDDDELVEIFKVLSLLYPYTGIYFDMFEAKVFFT